MRKRTKPLDFKLRKSARATFDAQSITSDAGLLLLRSLDDRLGREDKQTARIGRVVGEPPRPRAQ